jgi:hypothetical protein
VFGPLDIIRTSSSTLVEEVKFFSLRINSLTSLTSPYAASDRKSLLINNRTPALAFRGRGGDTSSPNVGAWRWRSTSKLLAARSNAARSNAVRILVPFSARARSIVMTVTGHTRDTTGTSATLSPLHAAKSRRKIAPKRTLRHHNRTRISTIKNSLEFSHFSSELARLFRHPQPPSRPCQTWPLVPIRQPRLYRGVRRPRTTPHASRGSVPPSTRLHGPRSTITRHTTL